jgi:hypothetical protein
MIERFLSGGPGLTVVEASYVVSQGGCPYMACPGHGAYDAAEIARLLDDDISNSLPPIQWIDLTVQP